MMDIPEIIIGLITGLPNLAGLSILSFVLYKQNIRLMDFQERMMANQTDDLAGIRHDVKRIKDKMNLVD
jgi:hypothetical protein